MRKNTAYSKSTAQEAKAIAEQVDRIDEQIRLWDEMLKASIETNQALKAEKASENKKDTTDNGDVQYSERPFSEQVDDVLAGTFDRSNAVYVGMTPKILQDVGLKGNLPMLTTASHIRNANKPKNTKKHYHGLTEKQIKNIPTKIAQPVMIMESLDRTKNSIVVVTDMLDVDNSPIVVTIKTDGKGMYSNVEIDTNFLTGYYGRDGFANFIENNVSLDTFLYINKEKATILSTESNSSWFEQLKDYDFDIIIRKHTQKSQEKFSERDNLGNELSKEQVDYFKDSIVKDENGNLKVMYHGTPNATFTKFKSGTYFTEHKWYADNFQSQGASSLGYKKTSDNPDTYAVYLNIQKPFDTRNKEAKNIFYNEYYQQWGTGTDLMESGLPDWLDGQDLQEFLEEKGYDYDGLILDEGAVGGYGDTVKSRGLSYVVFNSNQVKSVNNKKPTDDADINYSDRDYSYDTLVSKPNMNLTIINDTKIYQTNKQARVDVINKGVKNASTFGKTNEKGNAVVFVEDIKHDIIVSKSALRHGIDRRFTLQAPVIEKNWWDIKKCNKNQRINIKEQKCQ